MKKFLPKTATNPKGFIPHRSGTGFTLIELLIAVAIIAILSTIGLAVYTGLGLQAKSRNSVRRGDLDAIAKTLEVSFAKNGTYPVLAGSLFSTGKIPTLDPQGFAYCGNSSYDAAPVNITAVSTATVCTPVGSASASGYLPISTTVPAAGASWKICTWLEGEVNPIKSAEAYCRISSQ